MGVNGESVQTKPAPTSRTMSLEEIQLLLKYAGPAVAVGDMRVTDHRD